MLRNEHRPFLFPILSPFFSLFRYFFNVLFPSFPFGTCHSSLLLDAGLLSLLPSCETNVLRSGFPILSRFRSIYCFIPCGFFPRFPHCDFVPYFVIYFTHTSLDFLSACRFYVYPCFSNLESGRNLPRRNYDNDYHYSLPR